ncbi:hypothetical protein ACFQI3_10510 [Hansschlegelia quercus]|uniref:Uncharacterized protein n=1 Tax=Hansschlegelia quercus TaxID=2528245 RepID=A0A4Q9GQZ6_9HYPH|nr:hypothetical protein [Hansschlegelia quercus]TBN54490.1 hypothetical protein EYR15_06580 [Hansschlegelia quercus]
MMKKTAGVMAALGALVLTTAPALAVTVTNLSDKAVEVTADRGVEEPKTKIEAGETVRLDCPGGCELRAPTMAYGLSAMPGDKAVFGKDNMLAYEDSGAKPAKSKTN